MGDERIKVLIVDDSAIVRGVLTDYLAAQPDIEVVGTAPDPFIARDKILKYKPDVLTLDIEMPRMDGLTFLGKLMTYYPLPVIIVSSITTRDPTASIKALEIGAFDVVNKPGGSTSVAEVIDDVLDKIRRAYKVKDIYVQRGAEVRSILDKQRKPAYDENVLSKIATTDKFIAIGASTGGTVALEYIFAHLPASLPPVLVVQHMPPVFTKQFADRLNELSDLTIREAGDGDLVIPGNAYIAPGGLHMTVQRKGNLMFTRLIDTERVHFQKPAVDVLFESLAREVGRNCVAFLLTGMGKDGAAGMKALKDAGAYTVAQDEKSSIVWGMPKAAVDLDAQREIVPLEDVPRRIVEIAGGIEL